MVNRRAARILALAAALICAGAPAHADPIKYALVNAIFGDGGKATGYVVYEAPPAPERPRVTDWAIDVSGGTAGIRQFSYDPTNSAVSIDGDPANLLTFVALPGLFSTCAGVPRRIQFDLLLLGPLAAETCQVTRQFVAGGFQRVPGPVITLKIDGQHPASRVVFGGSSLFLTADISPAGWTTPLDWYWAIQTDLGLFWVTAGGLSASPAPLTHAAPVLATNVPLLLTQLYGDTQAKFWLIATNGSGLLAFDQITVISPPSP